MNNNILIVDRYNESKAHHIKFIDGKVFYNQAIAVNEKRGEGREVFKYDGEEWFDFYDDEEVTNQKHHGYQHYIDLAKKQYDAKHNIKFTALKGLAADARADAINTARLYFPFVRSRGVFLTAYDANNNKMDDGFDAELSKFTKKEFFYFYNDLKERGGVRFYLDGVIDGAESLREFYETYEPYVSEWCIEIEVNGDLFTVK